MKKRTPGLWQIDNELGGDPDRTTFMELSSKHEVEFITVIAPEYGDGIDRPADVAYVPPSPEQIHDARLIAAIPELLEVVEFMALSFKNGKPPPARIVRTLHDMAVLAIKGIDMDSYS